MCLQHIQPGGFLGLGHPFKSPDVVGHHFTEVVVFQGHITLRFTPTFLRYTATRNVRRNLVGRQEQHSICLLAPRPLADDI